MKKRFDTKPIKVSKEILKYLLLAGVIFVAASSPYFALNLAKNISKLRRQNKRKINSAFQYLRRNGLIEIKRENHDICIALTDKGKKRAGKYQVDDLEIRPPKKWDKKWRVVIFDIPNLKKTERDAFRSKLKELGFYSLQKSVWVHPFDCKKEIELLREFLGTSPHQIRLLVAEKIENEQQLKKALKL